MWRKVLIWLGKAWAWVKKYWKWILLPVGILLALAELARVFWPKPKPTVVVEDKKPTAAADVAIHDNQTAAQVQQATQATAEQIQEIEEQFKETLAKINASQRLEYELLKQKPSQEITNWLLKVGKGS